MQTLGVGLIGFGFMGKTRAYSYQTLPLFYPNLGCKFRYVGVCTPTLTNAQKAKEILNFDYATADWRDLIDDPNIQLINISSPNAYHYEQAMAAIAAGKHVFCDKPLAVSAAQAQEMADAARKKGVICQVALHNRFYPSTIRARQLVEEDRLGRILSFRACYLHSGAVDETKPIGWRSDANVAVGGVFFDLGSHVLDLVYYLIGEYDSLTAVSQILYPQRPDGKGNMVDISCDDATYLMCRMKDGAVGTIESSKCATGVDDELRVEIHGTKGALRFNLSQADFLEFYDNTLPEGAYGGEKGFTKIACVSRFPKAMSDFPPFKLSPGWLRGHAHCLYNFVQGVLNNETVSPSFDEGAYIQRVMEAGYRSARDGTWVQVDAE